MADGDNESVQHHIDVEDHPHLQYIVSRAAEYNNRLTSWELEQEKSLRIRLIKAPEILVEHETILHVEENNGEYTFPDKGSRVSKCTQVNESKSDKPLVPEDCYIIDRPKRFQLLVKSEKCSKKWNTEKIKLTEKNKTAVLKLLEDDIFRYVRETNEILREKSELVDDHIYMLILTGEAILHECPIKTDKDISIEKLVLPKMDRLRDEGVMGYGYAENRLCVTVLEKGRNSEEKESFEKKIQSETSFADKLNILWFKDSPFNLFTRPGERLICKSKLENFQTERTGSGAIGVFGTTKYKKKVLTTAGHVFPKKEKEEAFIRITDPALKEPVDLKDAAEGQIPVDTQPTLKDQQNKPEDDLTTSQKFSPELREKDVTKLIRVCPSHISVRPSSLTEDFERIGTCVAHLGNGKENECDFAVVEIDDNKSHLFEGNVFKTEFKSTIETSLYTEEYGKLDRTFVQKVGPESSWTEGIVCCDPFYFTGEELEKKRPYVLVRGKDPKEPFAVPGDSGSPMYKMQFDDKNNPILKIVSTVLMGSSKKSKDPHVVVTQRIDDAIKEVKREKNLEVVIDEIKKTEDE